MAQAPDFNIDTANLYREDSYTDRKVGLVRVMTPVTSDGTPDASRTPLFAGEVQILTPMGALPVHFEIEATTLTEAIAKYSDAAQAGVERTVNELREMQRQAQSSIVIPQGNAGLPGGGKIQLK